MASAIRGGDALLPAATAVRITGGPDAPIVTDGPFAETAEVAGGYYLFEAENLDGALAFARDIPAAKHGAVEVWPMFGSFQPTRREGSRGRAGQPRMGGVGRTAPRIHGRSRRSHHRRSRPA